MSRRVSPRWLALAAAIEAGGFYARLGGTPLEDNPYRAGRQNRHGPGGMFQRLRREAWARGWHAADAKESS